MTEERKKRFYPKRGDYVVSREKIAFKPVSVGRNAIDDSELITEAVNGIKCGTYKNANQAALSIAKRIGGPYFKARLRGQRVARV